MRGSPLLRTLLLAAGLLVAGWGMLRFLAVPESRAAGGPMPQDDSGNAIPKSRCGFAIKVSHAPESLQLSGHGGRVLLDWKTGQALNGMLLLDPTDPLVFVSVRWSGPNPGAADHFVKLTLEPAGRPTLSRYFETPDAELQDVWELPAE